MTSGPKRKVAYKLFDYAETYDRVTKEQGFFGEYEERTSCYKYRFPEEVRDAAVQFASSLPSGCLINISGGDSFFAPLAGGRLGGVVVYYYEYV